MPPLLPLVPPPSLPPYTRPNAPTTTTRCRCRRQVYSMFVDVKRSTQFLIEYQEQYMYNEVPDAPAGEEMETCG